MDMASGAQNLDLSKLSPQDQQELRQFVVNENQKAHIQQSMFSLSHPDHQLDLSSCIFPIDLAIDIILSLP
jgi:hypothetical protein